MPHASESVSIYSYMLKAVAENLMIKLPIIYLYIQILYRFYISRCRNDEIEKKLKESEQREEALLKRITEKDKSMAKMA